MTLTPMKSMKMWIGNLDGQRQALVIAPSKKRAREILGVGRKEFDGYWALQPGVDQGFEFEVLYTRKLGTDSRWTQGRCPL